MLSSRLVHITLGQGLDTKSDPKAVIPGKLVALQNAVFTKPGALKVRNGYDILDRSVDSSGTSLSQGDGLATRDNELLCFSAGYAYTRLESTDHWVSRGASTSPKLTTRQVIANSYAQTEPDVAVNEGVRVTVWIDSRGGARCSVHDVETDAPIVTDYSLHTTATRVRVVSFLREIVVFYSAGANLYYRRIPVLSPAAIGAQVNIKTTLSTSRPDFDVCPVVTGTDGVIFICWNEAAQVNLTTLSTAYALGSSVTLAGTTTSSLGIWTDDAQRIWFGFEVGGSLYVGCSTMTLVVVLSPTILSAVNSLQSITGYVTGDTATVTWTYLDTDNATPMVRTVTVTTAGTTGSSSIFVYGLRAWSKWFTYEGRWYIATHFNSSIQPSFFILDDSGRCVAKVHPAAGSTFRSTSVLSHAPSPATGQFEIAFCRRTRLEVQSGSLFAVTSVTTGTFDFTATNVYQSCKTGRLLTVAGACPQVYDGVALVESGFHHYPETPTSDTSGTFSIAVTQDGTGLLPEITDIGCIAGSRIKPGQYFGIYEATDATHFCVYFTVDGVGTNPGLWDVQVAVAVLSTDTSSGVATKLAAAITSGTGGAISASAVGSTVTATNAANGVTTNASSPAAPLGPGTGSVTAGSRYYQVLYEWTDGQGGIHLSAPSAPLLVTLGSTGSTTLRIQPLRLTSKADVRIKVFRTENGGTNYFRVPSELVSGGNALSVASSQYIYVLDDTTDAALIGNELLYTLGGVVENAATPAASFAAPYRRRLLLAGLEDPDAIAYSKQIDEATPAAFVDAFVLRCAPTGGAIVGLATIDDKCLVLKRSALFVFAGAGPLDTSDQNDFGEPALLTADLGCSSARSIVQTPLGVMFQSPKGIYLVDRSLGVKYIGADVEAYNGLTVTGAALVPNTTQVRFVTSTVCLVYDYLVGQWSTFTNHESNGCAVWKDRFVFVKRSGYVHVENQTATRDGSTFIPLYLELGWLQMGGLNGYQRVRNLILAGNYKGSHYLRIRVATDYAPAWTQERTVDAQAILGAGTYGSTGPYGTSSGGVYGGAWHPYSWDMQLKHQKSTAVRFSVESLENTAAEAYDAVEINEITLDVGVLPVFKQANNRSI